MANKDNLIPNSERTPNERRENAQKAGKASGNARRKKKQIRQMVSLILGLDAGANQQTALTALGVPDEDQTMGMAVVAQQLLAALRGDTKAAEFLMKYAGADPRLELEKEKIRIERDRLSALLAGDKPNGKTSNLLEAIKESTREDMDVDGISEIQQASDSDDDVVESSEVQEE